MVQKDANLRLTIGLSLLDLAVSDLLTTQADAKPTENFVPAAPPVSAVEVDSMIRGIPEAISDSEIYAARARTDASTAVCTSHLQVGSTSILPLLENARWKSCS